MKNISREEVSSERAGAVAAAELTDRSGFRTR